MTTSEDLGAWLLPIDNMKSVAVGRYELKYIEYVNNSVRLPGLPAYCEEGFLWRNHFVPAMDLNELVARRRNRPATSERMAAILAYENAVGDISVGAIFLRGVPRLINVQSTQSVALANLGTPWQLLAHAAFQMDDKSYPVLDLRALFDRTPADLLAMH